MPRILYFQTIKPVCVTKNDLWDTFDGTNGSCDISRENDFADVVVVWKHPHGRKVHVPPANIAGIVYQEALGEAQTGSFAGIDKSTSDPILDVTRDLGPPIPAKNKGGRPKKA